MSMESLFDKRAIVRQKLLNIIKDNGYTKSSFAKVLDITRPTLDRLLAGEIESLTNFRQYIEKITRTQGMTEEKLLNYIPKYHANNSPGCMASNEAQRNDQPVLVNPFSVPDKCEIKDPEKEMFLILDDILNICEVYYSK